MAERNNRTILDMSKKHVKSKLVTCVVKPIQLISNKKSIWKTTTRSMEWKEAWDFPWEHCSCAYLDEKISELDDKRARSNKDVRISHHFTTHVAEYCNWCEYFILLALAQFGTKQHENCRFPSLFCSFFLFPDLQWSRGRREIEPRAD